MNRAWLIALLALSSLTGCHSPTDSPTDYQTGPRPMPAALPTWLQGSWVHDDGTHTPNYLTLDGDGSFDWQGADETVGKWSSDGSTLSFDTYSSGVDFQFVTGCHVIALLGQDYYDSGNDTSDCPRTSSLSPLESCAVGTFSYTNNIGAKYTYTLSADRTYVESYYYDGYLSSGGYNVYGAFAIDDAGDVIVTHTNGSMQKRLSVAGLAGMSRSDSAPSGCDAAAWNALAQPNDPCAATTANGIFCGASTQYGFSGGDPDTLYDCENGATANTTACAAGCVVEPEGTADHCL